MPLCVSAGPASAPAVASTLSSNNPAVIDEVGERKMQRALEKYGELYRYSTDVLLNEHGRFIRADDKASKYSTMFVFLMGIAAYFDKWIFDRFLKLTPEVSIAWPPADWQLLAVGAVALMASLLGWFLANHVMMMRPFASRSLNQETLDFFNKHTLLNFYGSFSKRNMENYQENRKTTDTKFRLLFWAHWAMIVSVLTLITLVAMYCLYSWA